MGAIPAGEAFTDALLTALRAVDGTGDYWFDLTGDDRVIEADTLEPTLDSHQVALCKVELTSVSGEVMGYYGLTWTCLLMGYAPATADTPSSAARQAYRLLNDCTLAVQRMRDSSPSIATLAKGDAIDVRITGATRHGDSIDQDLYGGLGMFAATVEITAEVEEGA